MHPSTITALDENLRDVIVIGGGPAGSTIATRLARDGHDVALYEKARHPRFHIGESLLPMNLPILEDLGMLGEVAALGVHKPGADFTRAGSDTANYAFARALGRSPPHAFQVNRAEFDHALLNNARRHGAQVFEGTTVTGVALEDDRRTVTVRDASGRTEVHACRFLVDASGQDCLVASRQRWRTRDRRHSAAAVYSHFEGAVLRDGVLAGNISIYWFDAGWIWAIPLRGGLLSVGAVCRPGFFRDRHASLDAFLLAAVRRSDEAWARIEHARMALPARAAANYTYTSKRQFGDGYALVGDAYAFIDPVFSSGVFIAMSSACTLQAPIEHWLRGDVKAYRRTARRFHRDVRRSLDCYRWFIFRFMTPAMASLMSNPRNVLNVERAVISVLAGDVRGTPGVRSRLALFRLIYAVAAVLERVRAARRTHAA